MENQKVHEYTVETGPNGLPQARLGRVHNLITFVKGGSEKIHYLDGKWVDDGRNPIPEDQVPEEYKRAVASIPFKPVRDDRGSQVIVDCEFCPYTGPSGEYARHLAEAHIRPSNAASAQALAPGLDQPVDPAVVDQPLRLRPEQLPPGNYVLDEEGFVVLNQDGTPRKKAGRPPKAAA